MSDDRIPPDEAAIVSVDLEELEVFIPDAISDPIPDVALFLLAISMRWKDRRFVNEQIDWLKRAAFTPRRN